MLYSIVRAALVASVTWACSAVRFQARKLSTVPKHSSPRSARSREPGMLSSIHCSFVPEK